jgi:hypothetical protein
VVLALPLVALPFSVPGWTPPNHGPLPFWVLSLLVVVAGIPYAVVTTTSPLLQRWFSTTDHPHAADPYFLYAAGNAGSLLGLLAYPVLIEPRFALATQSRLWFGAYGLFVVLMALAVVTVRRRDRAAVAAIGTVIVDTGPADDLSLLDGAPAAAGPVPQALLRPAPTAAMRVQWLCLAMVPSSLLVAVTTHITVDVAAVPLLWAIPLALYLLTFVIAFARHRLIPTWVPALILPALVANLALRDLQDRSGRIAVELVLHFGTMFVAALACHGRLADIRPAAEHLTEFFVWVSIGGALGGAFNALLAPVLFESLVEYPVALAAVLLLRPPARYPFTILTAVVAVVGAIVATRLVYDHPQAAFWVLLGTVVLTQRRVVAPFLAVTIALGVAVYRDNGLYILRERTFFGTLSVSEDDTWRALSHGTTLHGQQALDPAKRRIPTTYYARSGPIGQAIAAVADDPRGDRIGVVGLGVGTVAAYSLPDNRITYFEIDAAVTRLARDTRYFHYLGDAQGPVDVVLGDARLSLQRQPAGTFGLLALDAFSSDAIPIHLLTTDAIEDYLRALRHDGLLLVHISNRYVDLEPVVAAVADDLGLAVRTFDDFTITDEQAEEGKEASEWMALARTESDMFVLDGHGDWKPARRDKGVDAWTDESSDLWSVLIL